MIRVPSFGTVVRYVLERRAALAEGIEDYQRLADLCCLLAWVAMLDRDSAQQARDRYAAGGGRDLQELLRRWGAWQNAQRVLEFQVGRARQARARAVPS